MAEGRVYACSGCKREIVAWDEGDPYYLEYPGRTKRYAYHPSHERILCTHVDIPVLCLACGAESVCDSARPLEACPVCKEDSLVNTFQLEGRRCPTCGDGVFQVDRDRGIIS